MSVTFLILIFISAPLWGQTKGGPQCDPVEAERQCFSLLCTQTPKKLIPLDENELKEASSSFPYTLPAETQTGYESLANLAASIQEANRELISQGKEGQMARELMESPVDAMNQLAFLFENDLTCVYQDQKCTLIENDLSELPPGFSDFYKNLADFTFFFRDGKDLPVKEQKKFLEKVLDQVAHTLSPEVVARERQAIKNMKQWFDILMYYTGSLAVESYLKTFATENSRYQEALAGAIKKKLEESQELDFSENGAKKNLIRSCQTAAYVLATVNQNATPEKFNQDKARVLESFRTKFLPTLSAQSGKELSESLGKDPFFLININPQFHPYGPNLGPHRNGYNRPENTTEVIRDLALLNQSDSYRCRLGGSLVGDSFNYGTGQISVSKFVLANSYTDAITHELGHWLSAQMKDKKMSSGSRRKLLRVRNCVKGYYPRERAQSSFALAHKGDRLRTEEDFADWFTAKAGLGENGLFCDLKKMTSVLGGPVGASLYIPEDGDAHSNFLFREMSLRLNRGENLPQSCKDLLESFPNAAPKKCDM